MKFKKVFQIQKSKTNIIEKREFKIGEYSILLNSNHNIDTFYKQFPLYDRFLPLLCSNLKGLIIDIGANIGDTSVAIFSMNKKSFLVGVEPDENFFNECILNIERNNLGHNFLQIKNFISTSKGYFEINKNKTESTGYISKNIEIDKPSNAISFSELMNLIPDEKKQVFDVLKIDTDGFDWDIINSFLDYSLLEKKLPRFIFFEMQTFLNNEELIDNNRQEMMNNYKQSLNNLKNIGYNTFCLFDNFGTHLKITNSLDDVFDLMNYLYRSQTMNKIATIYYFDVLVFKDNEIDYVNTTLKKMYESISIK